MVFSQKILSFVSFHTTLSLLDYCKKIKTIVQVGSHDGEMHDPLREFILKNKWAGLLIEPQKKMLEKCKQNYQNIDNLSFINLAVHPTKSNVRLYKVDNPLDYSHTGWASINPGRFANTIYENRIKTENVRALPLMQIIKDNNFDAVDLLQIDTEGFDADVISMFDFNSFNPVLIQFEHIHLSEEVHKYTCNNLTSIGYYLIKKKNDTFAIRKDLITIWFILGYVVFRMSASLTSRMKNLFNSADSK